MVHLPCGIYFHCPLRKYCRRALRKVSGKPAPVTKPRRAAWHDIPGISEAVEIEDGTSRIKVSIPRTRQPFYLANSSPLSY